MTLDLILLQAEEAAQQGSQWSFWIMMILIFVVFYFFQLWCDWTIVLVVAARGKVETDHCCHHNDQQTP